MFAFVFSPLLKSIELFFNTITFMSRKTVLVISNLYPSDRDPYFGTFVRNFVDDLQHNSNTQRIDLCVIRGRSYHLWTKIRKYAAFYCSILYKLLFRRYDLVYVHIITHAALPLRFVDLFKRLPLVFNIHGEDLITQTKLAAFFLRIVTPLLVRSELIVVPSHFFRQKVERLLPLVPADKLYVSASGGVKDFFFDTVKPQAERDVPLIGYVSRIDRGKGWDVFLKALKILADRGMKFRARLAGRGEETDLMNELLAELNLTGVEYIGPVAYGDLPEVYADFDLFVFPTLLEESLGLVGLEAMACHTPVIGSRIGGLTDYIEDGVNGFLFDPGDEHSLAEKILEFIAYSPSQREIIQRNAYNTALKFKSSEVADRLFRKLELL